MSKRQKFTPESFKKTFAVGDIVESFSTNKRMTITAIGETRFFAKDFGVRARERACTMNHAQGWTKVNPSDDYKTH